MVAIDSGAAADAPTPRFEEIDGSAAMPRAALLDVRDALRPGGLFMVTLPSAANRLCDWVIRIDELSLRAGISLPFGGSLLIVARKSWR